MSNPTKSVLTYFGKMARGEVPTDGELIVKRALNEDLMTKSGLARYFGVQEKQVTKISGNLRDRDVRKFCEHICELHNA